MKLYNNFTYLANRIVGCIVNTTQKEPVFVLSKIGVGKFSCRYLHSYCDDEVTLLDRDLDLSPVPLGFVNTGVLTYLTRIPMREDWRQGLRANNCFSKIGYSFTDVLKTDLRKTIVGDFPSYEEVVYKAFKKKECTAFHRKWAVRNDGELLYRGKCVGSVDQLGSCRFINGYSYLKNNLEVSVKWQKS